MLNSKRIERFFENNPKGYINLIEIDGKEFRLKKDIPYSLDDNSITFHNITYTDKIYGNEYRRKGTFVLPFNGVIRVEYIKTFDE